MLITALVSAIHAMAAVAWVGGIFFAYMALRPAADALEPPVRLALWRRTFANFFPWVWLFIALLLVTGYADSYLRLGGPFGSGLYMHLMHVIGLVMTLLFVYLYFVPYRALCAAVDAGDTPRAARAMGRARPVMVANLTLGLLNTAIGVAGPLVT